MKTYGTGKTADQDINVKGVPREVLDWVRHYAQLDGRSMSKQVIHVLQEYVAARREREKGAKQQDGAP